MDTSLDTLGDACSDREERRGEERRGQLSKCFSNWAGDLSNLAEEEIIVPDVFLGQDNIKSLLFNIHARRLDPNDLPILLDVRLSTTETLYAPNYPHFSGFFLENVSALEST